MTELSTKKCIPCEGSVAPLERKKAEQLLTELQNWELNTDATEISKTFTFKGFYKTMAFTNAVAWIANQEMHHPDLEISYNSCRIRFTTHAINGLSENDFICAAKVDNLGE